METRSRKEMVDQKSEGQSGTQGSIMGPLNPVHTDLVTHYLQLSHYQLTQRLKSIHHCFSSLLAYKVRDDETYGGDEIRELLVDLDELVTGEVESELTDAIHTNVLLVHQLLAKAEEWNLTLKTNLAELENREKLNVIKEFEESLKKGPKKSITLTITKDTRGPTDPDSTLASILRDQLDEASAQNSRLTERIAALEAQLEKNSSAPEEAILRPSELQQLQTIERLSTELEKAQAEIQNLTTKTTSSQDQTQTQLQSVQAAVKSMSEELERGRLLAQEETEKLRRELESREAKLREVTSNLILAERELETKFQGTGAYLNMKRLLSGKNELIKGLRRCLAELGHHHEGDDKDLDDDES